MLTHLKWLLLMSLLNVNADQEATMRKSDERPIVVKMDPEQVVETFKSVLYSPYFKDMANQIATKAVEHYINEVLVKEINAPTSKKDIVNSEAGEKILARQRQKYSAQHTSQQQQQQQLQLQKLQALKLQQLKLQQQKLQQQKLQQQKLQQQKLQQSEVIIEHDKKKNVQAKTSILVSNDEPQSHMSVSDSDSQGQIDNKLKEVVPNKSILSEQVAYALLKDPSPDGDLGLGLDSLEQPTSPKPPPPPKKINGMYFRKRRRRLLSK